MQTTSQLVNVYVTLIKNFGIFADDGDMVREEVRAVIQGAVSHIRLTDPSTTSQTLEEFRDALTALLQVLQSDHAGSIEVLKLAISLLPHSNG